MPRPVRFSPGRARAGAALCVLGVACALAPASRAADPGSPTFHAVPNEHATLAAALAAATAGDTVGVRADFVATGPVTVPALALAVLGAWSADWSSRDPAGAPTTLQGNAAAPVLQFAAGATPATVVDGFRVTGGGGAARTAPAPA